MKIINPFQSQGAALQHPWTRRFFPEGCTATPLSSLRSVVFWREISRSLAVALKVHNIARRVQKTAKRKKAPIKSYVYINIVENFRKQKL